MAATMGMAPHPNVKERIKFTMGKDGRAKPAWGTTFVHAKAVKQVTYHLDGFSTFLNLQSMIVTDDGGGGPPGRGDGGDPPEASGSAGGDGPVADDGADGAGPGPEGPDAAHPGPTRRATAAA